jgi:hypothetical protein
VKTPMSAYASTILPTKIVWSPVVNWSQTVHSKWAMHSRIAGAFSFLAGIGVRFAFLNLSKLLPVNEPHATTAWSSSSVGMFMMNSFVSSMRVWEWRGGARLIATSGGLPEVGIAQARVVMFGLPVFPVQEIRTVCIGWRSLCAEVMLTFVFIDIFFALLMVYLYCMAMLSSLFFFLISYCVLIFYIFH